MTFLTSPLRWKKKWDTNVKMGKLFFRSTAGVRISHGKEIMQSEESWWLGKQRTENVKMFFCDFTRFASILWQSSATQILWNFFDIFPRRTQVFRIEYSEILIQFCGVQSQHFLHTNGFIAVDFANFIVSRVQQIQFQLHFLEHCLLYELGYFMTCPTMEGRTLRIISC